MEVRNFFKMIIPNQSFHYPNHHIHEKNRLMVYRYRSANALYNTDKFDDRASAPDFSYQEDSVVLARVDSFMEGQIVEGV